MGWGAWPATHIFWWQPTVMDFCQCLIMSAGPRWASWVDYLQCTLCCLLHSPSYTDFYRTVVLLILNQIIGNSETFSLRFNQLEWCDTSTRVYQFSTLGWGYLGQGTMIWNVFGIHAKNVWCCGEGYFGKKKIAGKVRKSRQNVNREKM